MAEVWIPGLLRVFCGGLDRVAAAGQNLGEVIADLERTCPGIGRRLVDGEALADGIAVAVDGEVSGRGLSLSVSPDSEVVFLPAVAGGRGLVCRCEVRLPPHGEFEEVATQLFLP